MISAAFSRERVKRACECEIPSQDGIRASQTYRIILEMERERWIEMTSCLWSFGLYINGSHRGNGGGYFGGSGGKAYGGEWESGSGQLFRGDMLINKIL